jgi:hypothetical protein
MVSTVVYDSRFQPHDLHLSLIAHIGQYGWPTNFVFEQQRMGRAGHRIG